MEDRPQRLCPVCQVPVLSQGVFHLRTGGTTGVMGALIGQWNQLGESLLDVAFYRCPQCHRLELYDPEG